MSATNKPSESPQPIEKALTPMQLFGKRLKQIREKKKISQKELAVAVQKGQAIIALWEKGEREINLSDAVKLSIRLDVPLSYLIEGDLFNVPNECKKYMTEKENSVLKAIYEDKKLMKELATHLHSKETLSRMVRLWETTTLLFDDFAHKDK